MIIYSDTFGVEIELVARFSMVGATGAHVAVSGPAGYYREFPATIVDQDAGSVRMLTEKSEMQTPGNYELQAVAEFGTSRRLRSEIFQIEVRRSVVKRS